MVRENLEILLIMSAAHSWTWHFLLCVGLAYPPFHLTFLGWATHFFLPFDLCHIIMTTDSMDPTTAKLQNHGVNMFESQSFCSYTYSWFSVSSAIIYIPLSHVDDVGYIMALLQHGCFLSTSTHYLGSWLRDSLPIPYSFHALMETSSHSMTSSCHRLSIGWFHGCLTSFYLFTFCELCCQYHGSHCHYWWFLSHFLMVHIIDRVIKWLPSMFEFNTFIHMLGFVLWLGRLERKTRG